MTTRAHFLVRGTLLGRPVANSLWYDMVSAGEGDLQEVADGIGAAYLELVAPMCSVSQIWVDTLVRVYDGGGPYSSVYQPADFPLTCENETAALPANVALLIRKTCEGPRPNRGRLYLPGMTEGSWDGDSWDNSAIANGEALGAALLSIGAGKLCLARPNDAANTAALFNIVTNIVVPGYAGSQRGRRF